MGAVIREARQDAGMTQQELATAAGVSIATVQRAESGSHTTSKLALRAIADALGVELAELEPAG